MEHSFCHAHSLIVSKFFYYTVAVLFPCSIIYLCFYSSIHSLPSHRAFVGFCDAMWMSQCWQFDCVRIVFQLFRLPQKQLLLLHIMYAYRYSSWLPTLDHKMLWVFVLIFAKNCIVGMLSF